MHPIATALDETTFRAQRRTILLDYANYAELIDDLAFALKTVTSASLLERSRKPECTPVNLMRSSGARAWEDVTGIHVQYSAGLSVELLREFFPTAIEHWEEYARYHVAFHESPESPYIVAHMTLGDDGYWDAIRMTSWAILLGHTDLLGRLAAIWDYGDQPLDGLLERLVAPYVPGRAPLPNECTRHLPYFKLLKVFDAAPEDRPPMMAKYMTDWYHASRREPYHGGHQKGREYGFYGYWSFEAAAVTIVLDIDDASYRDHEFYPRDMADFARSLANESCAGASSRGRDGARFNVPAGQLCPETGWWFTPAKPDSRRYFKQGEAMPDVGGDYGQTFWQWSPDQSAPKL